MRDELPIIFFRVLNSHGKILRCDLCYFFIFCMRNEVAHFIYFFVFLIPMGIHEQLCFHANVDFIRVYNESSLIRI